MLRALPGILIGGIAGSSARWAIGEIGWSPTATLLVVNTLGSAILGAVVASWPGHDHRSRLAAGLGFCGGLTTFSGLAVELARRLDQGAVTSALALTVSSMVFGVIAYMTGRRTVTR